MNSSSSINTEELGSLVEKGFISYGDGNYSSKYPKISELSEDGDVPFISGKNLKQGRISFDGMRYISKKLHSELKKGHIKDKDTLLVTRAGVGEVAYVTPDFDDANLNAQLVYLRADNKNIYKDFLYYYFSSKKVRDLLVSFSSGSAQGQLPIGALMKIPVEIPSINIQIKIAKILGDLDAKIELNRKMNKTLEEMGQALFKHYFINNPEAKGWEEKPLDQIADFLNGLASQKYPASKNEESIPVIKIREMSGGINEGTDRASTEFPEEYIINNGDFLFAWSGTLMTKIWTEGKGALNQHIFKVTSKKYPKWFYVHWTNYYLQEFVNIAKSKAVTMGHIKRSHLSEVLVKVPAVKFFETIGPTFDSLLKKQIANSIEISNLSKIRDSVLPKLINGDIEL